MKLFIRLAGIFGLIAVLAGVPAACAKPTSTTNLTSPSTSGSTSQTISVPLQQMLFLIAQLNAVMNFKFDRKDVTFPVQLQIPSVPVTWMGTIFNGKAKEAGPGEDVTDEVHGSVSADGQWIETIYYSRQITRSNNTGVFYRVTLNNIPLAYGAAGEAPNATFYQEGDVHKFVQKIEYTDGNFVNGTIVPGTSFVSLDWTNAATGKKPILQVTFETVASKPEQGPGSGPSGGM